MSFKQIGCIKTYVGIDPGANGGIAINRGGEVFLHKMPKTTLEFADLLKALHVGTTLVVIEKVGVRPDDVAVTDGAVNFGKLYRVQKMVANFEALKTALDLSGLAYVTAHPMKWQSFLSVRIKGMDKAVRKRHFKEVAQSLYPQTKQTLWSADATLIMHFGMMAAERNLQYFRSKMHKEKFRMLFRADLSAFKRV